MSRGEIEHIKREHDEICLALGKEIKALRKEAANVQSNSKGGRRSREPKPGERVQLGLRVTPEMKRLLDSASRASGRSQSQEAEIRLLRSFEQDPILSKLDQILEKMGLR